MNNHICKCHLPACTCPNNWALCRYCEAEITWVKTKAGRSMAIDGHVKAGFFDRDTQRSHWATCSNPPERQPRPAQPKAEPAPKVNPKQRNLFADMALEELKTTMRSIL